MALAIVQYSICHMDKYKNFIQIFDNIKLFQILVNFANKVVHHLSLSS